LVRTNYHFGGWGTTTSGGTNYNVGDSYTVTGNAILYARWTPVYTVTFNGNGATGSVPDTVKVDSGTVITLPGQGNLARTEYNFGGWNTNSGGTGTNYIGGSSYTITGNITLYAKWTITYTLTIVISPTNGGTALREPMENSYNTGTTVTVTAMPASGYTFMGWVGDATGMTNPMTITMNNNKMLTASFVQYGIFIDNRNGKAYTTVKIDNQMWMAENLNYSTASGSYCYTNNTDSCTKYGRVYDWEAAKIACPTGWHLPNRQEWDNLVTAVGSLAGTKLKSTSGWYNSGNGTDEYGFSALPGGDRSPEGYFYDTGRGGYWWTATESDIGNAYIRYMLYDGYYVYESNNIKGSVSVRCVED
jgi:uncharacterized protein (TIGR02145 family)/uncharacterized repeat protein (TIGR02543 family)